MSSATTDLLEEALSYTPGAPAPRAQALAAIFGALLGDAFGVPHEFKDARDLPHPKRLDLVMPSDYPKTYGAIPYGTWSDDGSQLLCLLDALEVEGGQLVLKTLGLRLQAWLHGAAHQAGGRVFDCGGQTRYALLRLKEGVTPSRAALNRHTDEPDPTSNGNGSLMRVLPAALATTLWGVSDEEAVYIGGQQSIITHAHPLSQVTCALYTQLAIQVMANPQRTDWYERARDAALKLEAEQALTHAQQMALDDIIQYGKTDMPVGSGFVVNSFWSAIFALDRSADYLQTIRRAVAFGNDTDTTACIAGGLAALAYGLKSVPTEWWASLDFPTETIALLERLPG